MSPNYRFTVETPANDETDAAIVAEVLTGAVRDERNNPDEPVATSFAELVDVYAKDEGTIWILSSSSSFGRDWLAEHLDPEAQRWPVGNTSGYVVEHRYVQDILAGAVEAGLTVREG